MKQRKKETSKFIDTSIGVRVMEFRRLVNLSQLEFSHKLEATQASISQIEAGKCLPSGNFIANLLEVFPEVNIHWLFLGIEKPFREDASAASQKKEPYKILNNIHEITAQINRMHSDVAQDLKLGMELRKKINK